MTLLFKLFVGITSTGTIVGSIAGLALTQAHNANTQENTNNSRYFISQFLNINSGKNQSLTKETLRLNKEKKQYSCFLHFVSKGLEANVPPKTTNVACEIISIAFETNQSSTSLSKLEKLNSSILVNDSNLVKDNLWKIKINSKEISNDKLKDIELISIDFVNNKQAEFKPLFELKNNQVVDSAYSLQVVKANITNPSTSFQHNNSNLYSCSFEESIIVDSSTKFSNCFISFLNQMPSSDQVLTANSFNFESLISGFDASYGSQEVTHDQYVIIKHSLLSEVTNLTKPINYFEQANAQGQWIKKASFTPVMNIFGHINSPEDSKPPKKSNQFFLPEELIK